MQDRIEKYEIVKQLGKEIFAKSDVVKSGKVSTQDIEIVKDFLKKAISLVKPAVLSLFFEHLIIAPELGKRLALKVKGVNQNKIEFLLWLHDLGRIVDPGGYLRNDIIDDHLLLEFGLPKNIIQELPPVRTFLQIGNMLNLSELQLQGKENLNQEQEKIASDYFNLLTPTQRIIFLADNFGKRDDGGKLFNLETFLQYVRTEKKRYAGDINWATDRMQGGEILGIYLVEKILESLVTLKVDFEEILNSLSDYGPKFIIVVRHGLLHNPKNIAYNRDSNMKKEDWIGLSDLGKEKLRNLAKLIETRKFRINQILTSPETRTVESLKSMNDILRIQDTKIDEDLDEIFAPGPYKEGLTIKFWEGIHGNTYDRNRWGSYNHEEVQTIIDRMNRVFWKAAKSLKKGEAAILVSHGDPIAWWINHQITGKEPDPARQSELLYPAKGQAIVAILDSQGKWFTHYLLN